MSVASLVRRVKRKRTRSGRLPRLGDPARRQQRHGRLRRPTRRPGEQQERPAQITSGYYGGHPAPIRGTRPVPASTTTAPSMDRATRTFRRTGRQCRWRRPIRSNAISRTPVSTMGRWPTSARRRTASPSTPHRTSVAPSTVRSTQRALVKRSTRSPERRRHGCDQLPSEPGIKLRCRGEVLELRLEPARRHRPQ